MSPCSLQFEVACSPHPGMYVNGRLRLDSGAPLSPVSVRKGLAAFSHRFKKKKRIELALVKSVSGQKSEMYEILDTTTSASKDRGVCIHADVQTEIFCNAYFSHSLHLHNSYASFPLDVARHH